MMNYVIIRTCSRDDYIARLCYESFKLLEIEANYIFSAENNSESYTWIHEPKIQIDFRSPCNNFGGRTGAEGLIDLLSVYNFNDDDRIILLDSDVVIFKNPFEMFPENIHHGGAGSQRGWNKTNGHYHDWEITDKHKRSGEVLNQISGQLQYYSGKFVNFITSLTREQKTVIGDELTKKIDLADDTFVSYISDKYKVNKIVLPLTDLGEARQYAENRAWLHQKLWDYEGRTDWQELINEIKEQTILSTQ